MARDGDKPPRGSKRSDDSIPDLDLDVVAPDLPAPTRESQPEEPTEPEIPKAKPAAKLPSRPKFTGSVLKEDAIELETHDPAPVQRSFGGEDLRPVRDFEMAPRKSLFSFSFKKLLILLILAGAGYGYLQWNSGAGMSFFQAPAQVIHEPRATANMPMGNFKLILNPKPDPRTEIKVGEQALTIGDEIRFSMLFNKGSVISVKREGFQPYSQKLFYPGYPAGITGDIPVLIDLAPVRYGSLVLTSTAPSKVVLEGSAGIWTKFTPVYNLKLPAGTYSIRFTRLDNGKESTQTLTVREDSLSQVSENLGEPAPAKTQ